MQRKLEDWRDGVTLGQYRKKMLLQDRKVSTCIDHHSSFKIFIFP
jgi:hypothetical protein